METIEHKEIVIEDTLSPRSIEDIKECYPAAHNAK